MTSRAMTIEMLPAGFGDCLLVSCPVGKRVWRMLIDTGPDETYPTLKKRLSQLTIAEDGHRHIDLLVVTHIDHDHIGSAKRLLEDKSLALTFGDIWFNSPPVPIARGVAERQRLATLLGVDSNSLPWNEAWSGGPVSTPAKGGGVELEAKNLPVLTLLSPSPKELNDLYKVWAKELERLRQMQRDPAEVMPLARGTRTTALEAIAERKTPEDKAIPNGSSIAFLLEHRGKSALFCADAFPSVLSQAIESVIQRRGLKGPLPVDVLKLSHHGSRANTTSELLKVVKAKHYLCSTNNSYFNHPDEEALARVIVDSDAPTLWFNYDTPKNRFWDSPDLKSKYCYRANYPNQANEGVTISL
jgi:beta-lactamase superfamily II metal-dependent hydrolase